MTRMTISNDAHGEGRYRGAVHNDSDLPSLASTHIVDDLDGLFARVVLRETGGGSSITDSDRSFIWSALERF